MAERKSGLTVPAGILQPTTQPDDRRADEEQGRVRDEALAAAKDDGQDVKGGPRATRKNNLREKASSAKAEGRKLYLPDSIHFRLRMLAYQRGQKLSECAAEVLDKALPKWNVDRIG
jgi:hypothetical protein